MAKADLHLGEAAVAAAEAPRMVEAEAEAVNNKAVGMVAVAGDH